MRGRVEERAVAVAPDGRGRQGASVAVRLKAYPDTSPYDSVDWNA